MNLLRKFSPLLIGLSLTLGLLALLHVPRTTAAPDSRTVTLTQTTLDDFNRGSFLQTGMTRLSDGEVTLLRLGIAGAWLTNTNSTGFVPRFEHAAVAYHNRLYVFGGRTSTGTTRSIQYATVNSTTHDVSNWLTATAALPTNVYTFTTGNAGVKGQAAVVLNDRVYLLGGDDGLLQHYYATVALVTIDADTGDVITVTATTPLPESLSDGQAVVLGNRLYYLGGRSPGGPVANQGSNEVYYAEPDPATGLISTWHTATAVLPYKTYNQMAIATVNDRLYSMAGVSVTTVGGGGIVPDVYYAQPLTATGDITGWLTTNAMPRNIFAGAAVSFGGQLYAIGGALDGISNASNLVFSALDRAAGGVSSWPGSSAIAPARLLHTAVINNDGWIYVIGGSTGSNQPIETHIINAGATAGESGSGYVDDGNFIALPFDMEKNYPLTQLSWTVNLPDPNVVTATLRYRYRVDGGAYSAWSAQYPAQFAAGVSTTTLPLAITARYVQYQVFFTTTNTTVSPILSRVDLQYIAPEPPLFLKTANPVGGSVVAAGERIVYTLTFQNKADLVLHNTFITDVVPARTTYVPGSIFASPGITLHAESAPNIYWEIGPLAPQAGGTVGFAVIVDAGLKYGDIIRNNATLDSSELIAHSPTVVHTVGAPYKLSVSHSTSAPGQTRGQAQPGDLITYTLIYTNPITNQPLTGVVITDQLPVSITYVTSLGTPAPTLTQGRLQWTIGNVPTNTAKTLQFVGRILTSTAQAPDGGNIVNVAQFGGTGLKTIDSQPDVVPIRYRFDLKLNMTSSRTKAQPGELITYTLRLTNVTAMPITATNIQVTDYLEPGLPDFTAPHVLACAAPCTGWFLVGDDPDGNTIYTALIPALGPNQATHLTFVAQVSPTLASQAPNVLAVANYAEAQADTAHGVEVDPSNQGQEQRAVVAGPDLAINTLTIGSNWRTTKQPITFYASVSNQGFASTVAADGTGWFGVDLYVKPVGAAAPLGPSDRYLGGCPTLTFDCPTTFRAAYYRVAKFYTTTVGQGGLGVNETWPLTFSVPITPTGSYWVYLQADTHGSPYGAANSTAAHGRIVEGDETNNLFGPVLITIGKGEVYLPLIRR